MTDKELQEIRDRLSEDYDETMRKLNETMFALKKVNKHKQSPTKKDRRRWRTNEKR